MFNTQILLWYMAQEGLTNWLRMLSFFAVIAPSPQPFTKGPTLLPDDPLLPIEITTGTVRLQDGASDREGRVEVLHNGSWHPICDDTWDELEADIVCRMLDFPGALLAKQYSHFGAGNGSILLDDLACLGNETDLLSCTHGGLYQNNCGSNEHAGVICQNTGRVSILVFKVCLY